MHRKKRVKTAKLTIEQLSKLTKLSVPTIRVYVARKKLGTKVGRNRIFSEADVQKLLGTSKGSPAKRKEPTRKNASSPKRPPRSGPSGKRAAEEKAAATHMAEPSVSSEKKRSFWSSLFGARRPKKKVNLLDVKTLR